MDYYTVAQSTIENNGGIAKTETLNNAGLNNKTIMQLCEKGSIKKLQQGYYYITEPDEEVIITKLYPEAIICLESALFYHGYSDWTPRKWTLALPRSISRSRLKSEALNYKPYFVQDSYFDVGLSTIEINGHTMRIYDKERCICDCFRYRTKMDVELFAKAVAAYANDPGKDIGRLYEYADIIGISGKVNNLMEVVLNGV